MANYRSSILFTRKLELLQKDYCTLTGRPFAHFFCPITRRDEDVRLCRAHIVNSAFPNSPRRWTVQRADVDSFYGSMFESEFTLLSGRNEGIAFDALMDKRLAKRLKPRILLDGKPIRHFYPKRAVPSDCSAVVLDSGEKQVLLGFNIAPEEMREIGEDRWGIEVEKDLRLHAVVSLLKSAYLALFELMGYRYALGGEGYFMGPQMLGRFFDECKSLSSRDVLERARTFFAPYGNLVRPILETSPAVAGTISDRRICLCGSSARTAWGVMVFVRAGEMRHGVVLPILENPDAAARFHTFLSGEQRKLIVLPARFQHTHWEVATRSFVLDWPPAPVVD